MIRTLLSSDKDLQFLSLPLPLPSPLQRLREEIPELEDNQRAPKVTILRKATDYIRLMQETKQSEEQELVTERRRYAQLIERLKKLKCGQI